MHVVGDDIGRKPAIRIRRLHSQNAAAVNLVLEQPHPPVVRTQEAPRLAVVHLPRIEDALERRQHRLDVVVRHVLGTQERPEVGAARDVAG